MAITPDGLSPAARCPNPACGGLVETRVQLLGVGGAGGSHFAATRPAAYWAGVISGNVLWVIGIAAVLVIVQPPFDISAAIVALALLGLAYQVAHHGRHRGAIQSGERLELREHRCRLCGFRWFQFDASPAMIAFERRRLERDLRLARLLRNRRATATILATLGLYALYDGERARAEALCAEATTLHEQVGNEKGATASRILLAESLVGWDDTSAAALLEESLTEARA